MATGPRWIGTISMASGETLSTGLTIDRSYEQMHIEIPTMTSGTDIYFRGSIDGTTFRRIYHSPTISNAAPGAFFLNSSSTNCMVDIEHRWYQYLKIELSTAMTATPATFKVLCF